jgi:hypothetical protein
MLRDMPLRIRSTADKLVNADVLIAVIGPRWHERWTNHQTRFASN